jgi:Transposase IS4
MPTKKGVDPRTVVGNVILAKAIHVTNEAECARRYGREKSTKMLEGTVLRVKVDVAAVTNRRSTKVVARYHLGGDVYKEKALLIRNLHLPKEPPAEATQEVIQEAVLEEETTTIVDEVAEATVVVESVVEANSGTPVSNITNATTIAATVLDTVMDTPPATMQLLTPPPPTTTAGPTVTVHGVEWFSDQNATFRDINGTFHRRQWFQRNAVGDMLTTGSNLDKSMTRLQTFLLMFPPNYLVEIVNLTNQQLTIASEKTTTKGEIVKFFGVILLITRFEFNSRSDLWSSKPINKYIPSPDFGKTGMPRKRFDTLWRYIRWSDQPKDRPDDMSSEQYRWLLVDGFVDAFNKYRSETFSPSESICVDESMSRWYGQGGDWINHGLPMYVAIDRKPENGCEIQSATCGVSGIMIQLLLVKTAVEQERISEGDNNNNNNQTMLHGIKVLKELTQPWFFSDRLVCADSYFASVAAAEELLRVRMRFIGVVKTATRRYPMDHLARLELNVRGDRVGLIATDESQSKYLAFVFMDRERRYFIATASSLDEGTPINRKRWRQVDNTANANPERLDITIPQPKAAALYYAVCGRVDQHNRDRQDTLMIEKKLKTHDWSQRVNLTILAMIFVDTYRIYARMTDSADDEVVVERQKVFYMNLASEMIDNRLDVAGRTTRQHARVGIYDDESIGESYAINSVTGAPRCGAAAHLTPTKRFRVTLAGVQTRTRFQGHCRVCDAKTTHQCSVCVDSADINDAGWICTAKNGKRCFSDHLRIVHGE